MRAAVLLFAFLASVAVQSNATCDLKGPIDKMAEKVCSFKGEVPGKAICLDCVKKIFKNEGTCKFDEVEFPGELDVCSASVKDQAFVDKLNELSVDKYVDKIEDMLEKIPALKRQSCTGNDEFDAFMNDDDDEVSLTDQCANTEFGGTMSTMKNSEGMQDMKECGKNMGMNCAKRNGTFCMKEFKNLIDRICGKQPICDKIKKCMEQIVGYIIKNFGGTKRRRRWIDALKMRNILSRPSLSAEIGSFSLF